MRTTCKVEQRAAMAGREGGREKARHDPEGQLRSERQTPGLEPGRLEQGHESGDHLESDQ